MPNRRLKGQTMKWKGFMTEKKSNLIYENDSCTSWTVRRQMPASTNVLIQTENTTMHVK